MPAIEVLPNGNVKIVIPISLRSCSGRKRIVAPEIMDNPTEPIVQNIVRAFHWQQMIDAGEFANAKELALAAGRDSSYVARTLRLTMLCPEIIHAALNGTLPAGVTLDVLRNTTMGDWEEQKKFVGMDEILEK